MASFRVFRNVRLGIKNLMLHATRSLLTTLGVVFGVGSVIAMLAVGEGASQQALEQIRKLGSNNIILQARKPLQDDSGSSGRRVMMSIFGLTYDDEQRIGEGIPSVVRTVPAKVLRKEGRLGERIMDLRIVGTTPGWFQLVPRRRLAGRVLNENDMARSAPVCVLTEHGARKLLAGENTIGQSITVGKELFTVVGIIRSEESSGAMDTPDEQVDAYIPLTTAVERYGDHIFQRTEGSFIREKIELHQIIVEIDSVEQVEASAAAIRSMLARFHRREDYEVQVPLALLRQAEATQRTFNIVLGSIAGISLLVGGIGIMNIMLATVTERTREIGIRRAIGAKRGQIVLQFLIETLVLAVTGGLIGIAMGMLIPWLIESFAGMPTVVTPSSIVLSLTISVAVGIVFGLYPAWRAAQLDPITALRHE